MGHGGARVGAGKKKGSRHKSTQEVRDLIDEIAKNRYKEKGLGVLFEKAFDLVDGVVVKDETGDGGTIVYQKPPDIAAIRYIGETRYGKATQAVDVDAPAMEKYNELLAKALSLKRNG